MIETPNTGTKVWNIEWKLVGFIFYISFLIASLFTGHTLNQVAIFHLCFVVIFSLFYFGFQFIYILLAPLMPFFLLISQFSVRRYLRKFKQNVHEDVVVVLAVVCTAGLVTVHAHTFCRAHFFLAYWANRIYTLALLLYHFKLWPHKLYTQPINSFY